MNTKRTHLLDIDKKYIWHPFTQMQDWCQEENLVIERAKGSFLYDLEGKEYIDGISSLWCTVHGHQKKELDEAIKEQLSKVAHTTFLGLSNVPATLLAEKLIRISPENLQKVFYSDSGSSAVEVALKMAYQYWQQKDSAKYKKKTKFIHLTESYHGDTLGSVSVGGMELFHKIYKPLLFETIAIPCPYAYRHCPEGLSEERYLRWCLKELEKAIADQQESVIGVIIEPRMLGAAGMLNQPKGYLKGVRELTKKYDVLMIADEVATGFGRTGEMFACDLEGVSPDLMTLGKGITGGYLPLSATLTSNEIYEAFLGDYQELKTFFHGHTYTGNPLAAAVSVANLELFEKENTLSALQPKIKQLESLLSEVKELPHVGDIRQEGFMVGIEIVKDKETKEPFAWEEKKAIQVILKAREKGVIIRPLGNVIILMPPLSIELDVLNKLVEVTKWAIQTVTEKRMS